MILSFLEGEDGRWILWFPVVLSVGIALYFSWPTEPQQALALPFLLIFGLFTWFYRKNLGLRRLGVAFFAISLGFFLSQWQAMRQDPPMLNTKLKDINITGTISEIEHLPFAKGFMYRLILDQPVAVDSEIPLPKRIRLTVRNSPSLLWTGQKIQFKVSLSPLTDPVSPGGYDFRRQAFFKGIGATGYSVTPPQILSSPLHSIWMDLEHLRHRLTRTFLQHMPAPTGSLAAALVTGDKASIPKNVRQQFADAGLAHILAISGLHLSIVAGLFFLLIQGGLALIPPLALRVPLHKIAAFLSLWGTGIYLILSGAGAPAKRSFIMTAFVLLAILTDRKAITLRLVSFAATIILILSPESLLSPSFQLSFAAVVALVAGYESCSEGIYRFFQYQRTWYQRLSLYVVSSLFSTLIATLATTPYTIFTFHRFTLQGVAANLVAIPLTSLFLMPCAVVTCFLMPFQEAPATIPLLSYGLRALATIAQEVSTWPGSVISVPRPPWIATPLMTLGMVWICLWRTRWRWAGLGLVLGGVIFMGKSPFPHIWVDGEGKVIGFEGRKKGPLLISSTGSGGFAVKSWLMEGNVPLSQKFPYNHRQENWECDDQSCLVHVDHKTRVLLAKDAAESPWHAEATVVVSLEPLRGACAQARVRIDRFDCWRSGSHGIWLTPQGPVVETSRQFQGERPWVRRPTYRPKNKKGGQGTYVKK